MNADPDVRPGILAVPCAYCLAGPGDWCRTNSGDRATYLHSARFHLWRDTEVDGPTWPGFPNWPPKVEETSD